MFLKTTIFTKLVSPYDKSCNKFSLSLEPFHLTLFILLMF